MDDRSRKRHDEPLERRRDLMMPAGRVLAVVAIALLVGMIFNSEAMVRAGEGMKEGTTRDAVLSVGRTVDDVTGAIGLHLPRDGFDLVFGQESKTESGTELESGSASILTPRAELERARQARRARREAAKPEFRQPTPTRPLKVFVTGDSQAAFVGQQLGALAPDGLIEVEVVPRNGTGLTNPSFFNWEVNAQQEIAARDPGAVVMVMGGNDGFNVDVEGTAYGPFTEEWETEYARRTAVVMDELGSGGRRPVYWVPPPTARDGTYNQIYAVQNRSVERAAEAVEGARYVDIYTTIGDGRYSDSLKIDGRQVLARQSDGVHFSREGAVVPARLILEAMAEDYPALGRGSG